MKLRIATAILFFLTGVCIVWSFSFKGPLSYFIIDLAAYIAVMASLLLLLFACVGMFLRPRLAHFIGLAAGVLALPWFALTEWWNFSRSNSWIALNLPGSVGEDGEIVPYIVFRILAVSFIVIVTVLCALRLLPARWTLRKSPVCQRTWPAFAVCFLILALWFGFAVTPYRLPGALDRVWPSLAVLHVEKRGLQFRETRIDVSSGYTGFSIWRNDRRLFQYRFWERGSGGMLPVAIRPRIPALLQSLQFKNLHTQPPKPLRKWNAEGWYFYGGGSEIQAFTSQYGTEPPKEVVDLFHEIEAEAPAGNWRQAEVKDICLGFCYDPLAGLGFVYANQRCFTSRFGDTTCE